MTNKYKFSSFDLFLTLLPGFAVISLTIVRQFRQPAGWYWEALPFAVSSSVLIISWVRHRALAIWSLPALGYLLTTGVPLLIGLFPESIRDIWGFIWQFGVTMAAGLLLWIQQQKRPFPLSFWLLLGLAFLPAPWELMLAGILLLPGALALLLAPQYGSQAALLPLAALYWPIALLFDPGYGLLIWSNNMTAYLALTLLPAILLLLVAPYGLLWARTHGQALAAALLPVAVGLLAGELWRSSILAATAHGAYDVHMWLIRSSMIVHYTLLLAWVLTGCWWQEQHGGMRKDLLLELVKSSYR